jgi:hypothetical protein
MDIIAVSGNSNRLISNVTQTLYNPGYISISNMGRAILQSYSLDGVYIGDVIVPNFHITTGYNFDNLLQTETIKTAGNQEALNTLLSNYAMGIDQQMWLRGPTEVITLNGEYAPFLYNVSNILVTLKGNPYNRLIANASVGGKKNSISPLEYIFNPLNLNITQTNAKFDIVQDPIPLTAAFGVDQMGYTGFDTNLFSTPYSCTSNDNAGTVGLAKPSQNLTANSWQTVLMDSTSGTNYCEGYLAVATCCGLIYGPDFGNLVPSNNFTVTVSGTFDVYVEGFTFTQTYRQSNVPIICDLSPGNYWAGLCLTADGNIPLASGWCLKSEKGHYCNPPFFNGSDAFEASHVVDSNPRKPTTITIN